MHSSTHAPRQYQGVMVSSTFTDLIQHRTALIKAIDGQELKAVVMENDTAKADVDVVDSSLQMVRKSAAYVGVISRKYGQVPDCPTRNPAALSITELEFNEAQQLKRPILLFIMGDKHPVTEQDVEFDAQKREKLAAFRERAKQMQPGSPIHRVYATFNSLEDFERGAIQAVAGLRRYLDEQATASAPAPSAPLPPAEATEPAPLPPPLAFRAEPPYIGSHDFVGRQAELHTLSDWAAPADTHPILLFEAIGGTGKSMLTWEWTTRHATVAQPEWAGRFWYSFYEQGTIMADFCQRALAYMTGAPLDDLRKKKTTELGPLLLAQLTARPWLLVLDGLERVLVAYHRSDAAQLADEEAGKTDQLADRDTCAAIRPEDDDLLRSLAGAAPSKLLLTTRLVPRRLLNDAGQPVQGVRRVSLPGLRPPDAEALFRACGVSGDSARIREYLQRECDCHPLTTGALAGLIVKNYLPDRGNFNSWVDDPDGGGKLNLAQLNLTQKRNHILLAAIAAAPERSRQLLATLALISEAVDFKLLSALNPYLPPKPEAVEKPMHPQTSWRWEHLTSEERHDKLVIYEQRMQWYSAQLVATQQAHKAWQQAAPHAQQELAETVLDLEDRGLLQYDNHTKRYDLHPVVRGVAAGGLRTEERNHHGQRIVDYFSEQAHRPYDEAETLQDVSGGIHLVRTLLQLERYESAYDACRGDLCDALCFNLEAHAEILALVRPFFPHGWSAATDEPYQGYLANVVAGALDGIREGKKALAVYAGLLEAVLQKTDWDSIQTVLVNTATCFANQDHLAKAGRCLELAVKLAELQLAEEQDIFFATLLRHFRYLTTIGQVAEAEALWQRLDPMGRAWPRAYYRPGDAEYDRLHFHFQQGVVQEEQLHQAEQLAKAGKNRNVIRLLYSLRGEWQVTQSQWQLAAGSFHEAVRLSHEAGQMDAWAEARYALAKFQLGQLPEARQEAERLAQARQPPHYALAELWRAIGEPEQARKYALAAYKKAWADGEPYVYRYDLNQARTLLQELGVAIPDLPPYDPAKEEKFPWEDEVRAAIAQLQARKEDEQAAEDAA